MIDSTLRNFIRQRAGNRCEYCRIRQEDEPFYRFHIEHITAKQHGGRDSSDNLALSCHQCNLHKGPNLSGVDPIDGTVVRLFNPRSDTWSEHFILEHGAVLGTTPIGRATARVLNMNSAARVELRRMAALI